MVEPGRHDGKVVAFKEKQAAARRAAMPRPDAEAERRRNRTNIAALILAAVLVAIGWLLVQELGQSARMQDCLMSGRTNCAPIAAPATN